MHAERIWPNGLRYLWTDAFGVVLLASLHAESGRRQYLDETEWLVAEVDRVLARPRGIRIGEAPDRDRRPLVTTGFDPRFARTCSDSAVSSPSSRRSSRRSTAAAQTEPISPFFTKCVRGTVSQRFDRAFGGAWLFGARVGIGAESSIGPFRLQYGLSTTGGRQWFARIGRWI